MIGTKIYFKDLYGGICTVHIRNNVNPGDVYDLLNKFMEIREDALQDDKAENAAWKFKSFAEGSGYTVILNSSEDAFEQFYFDLPSGNISPSIDVGETLSLPVNGLNDGEKTAATIDAISEMSDIDINRPEIDNKDFNVNWEVLVQDMISYDPSLEETLTNLLEIATSPIDTDESRNAKIKLMEIYAEVIKDDIQAEPIGVLESDVKSELTLSSEDGIKNLSILEKILEPKKIG